MDIQLFSESKNIQGILIELKEAGNFSEKKLKQLLKVDLTQIRDRKYDTDMFARVLKLPLKCEVAFSGNRSRLLWIFCKYYCVGKTESSIGVDRIIQINR